MKSYVDANGIYYRTQAEAKASGHPFELFDIPTDHAGLIFFINQLHSGFPVPAREPDPVPIHQTASDDPEREYQNGDPTALFMKSHDPAAVFTCVHCGKSNHNQTEKPKWEPDT